ncbi:F-box/WD repeat-containing protein 4 isoform X2 [Castor canadensis]|uniref:F-box/WD repeat-containing protein 4 isoform X2 n=1 Tax=Castor canadensis TaxID=51338 RepID=A0AC58MYS1_CASCN
MVSPPPGAVARLRVGPAPRPLMGSQGRPGPPGNRGPGEGEGEGGEARKLQDARVVRGKRRKGKGKADAGQGGRGSGAEGKPGPQRAKPAAGPGAEEGARAGPGREGGGGGSAEDGATSTVKRDEGSVGAGRAAQGSDDGQEEERRVRTGRRDDGRPGRAQGRGAQAWGGLAGTGAAMAAAAAEGEAAARPAAGPALWRLPEELLLLICSYLDVRALGRLAQVCRWLRRFTSCDLLWRRIARASLNSGFTRLGTDLMTSIPVKERVKVSQNWRLGRCREGILLKWRCRDGKIGVHEIHSTFTVKYSAHEQEVNCVDCKGGIIVSGSRDRTAKVWPLASGRLGQCLHTIQTEDRVWSIAISPLLSSFVTGTACCGHFSPLRIWDLNSGQLMTHLGSDFPPGAGVLDVMYESPSTLLSCGYDTYVRYWDLRTSVRKCVMEWEEPHDSTLYCLQTDGNHLLVTGSSYYGVVRLWDRRQRACLHAFPLTSTPLSSPVYCLRFTTNHLYAALSYNLHVLDFQNP